jgi:hypothetical protein
MGNNLFTSEGRSIEEVVFFQIGIEVVDGQ